MNTNSVSRSRLPCWSDCTIDPTASSMDISASSWGCRVLSTSSWVKCRRFCIQTGMVRSGWCNVAAVYGVSLPSSVPRSRGAGV